MFLVALASAAPYVDQGFVLDSSGPFTAGLSAPTVEWDGHQFVMYFEAPYADADIPSGCKSAYRIGRATSADGTTWTADRAAVLSPEPEIVDSPRACAVNQPAVVFDGTTWHLFFTQSGMPESQATSAGGIAYATSTNGTDFTIVGDPVIPASTNGIGLASAVIDGDTLYLVYSRTPDIYAATMDLGSGAWSIGVDPVLTAAAVGERAGSRVIAPSLRCADGEEVALTMVFGADDSAEDRVLTYATSSNGVDWAISSADLDLGSLDPNELGHWDLLAAGAGNNAMWYSADDPGSGLKAIGLAATGTSFTAPQARACVVTGDVDTGDTGDTGDSGDTGSTDTGDTGTVDTADSGPIDTGAGPKDTGDGNDTGTPGEGCACSSTRLGGAWVGLLVLGLLRRRQGAQSGPPSA